MTTYNAGMAVRDWPTTEGDWFYPLPKWLGADWDVFLEHGHRLLAQAVGLVTIALAVALWRLDPRKWMRWLAAAAVLGVIVQGVLGGLRVLGNELVLAKVHGCTGPLFFALCAALVTLTSRRWHETQRLRQRAASGGSHLLGRLAPVIVVALYAEIVLGAQLRHVSPVGPPGWFNVWVWLKLILAGLIALGSVWLLIHVLLRWHGQRTIVHRAELLVALFSVQLVLGATTWVTNYGWPLWVKTYVWPLTYTVAAEGGLQVLVTTVHAAVGSLTLVVALSLALWSRCLEETGSAPGFPRSPVDDLHASGRSPFLAAVKDYGRLVRPRILLLVLFSMLVAARVAGPQVPPWSDLAHAMLGTALVIAGAMALNQRLELRGDARMARTSGRPLPAGRLTHRQATWFGLVVSATGIGYLVVASHGGVVAVTVASWVVYVGVYTPLKSRTAWQTPVGAVAGAMPVLIGATVAHAPMSPTTAGLFGVVCLWQFPHAMAIAWLYRDEFAAANVKLATVVDPSGRTAGVLAVLGAAALIPVSLIPPLCAGTHWACAAVAVVLGGIYLACAVTFLVQPNDATARWLLRASLVYLPAVFLAMLLG